MQTNLRDGDGHARPPAERWCFGPFEFDARSLELRRTGRAVPLAPKPAAVLALLLSRAGLVVLRHELREHIWPRGGVDFDHALNTCIRQIRGALRDSAKAPAYIETLPRRGYRFRAPVERIQDDHQGVGGIPAPPPGGIAAPRERVAGTSATGAREGALRHTERPTAPAVGTRRRVRVGVGCAMALLAVTLVRSSGGPAEIDEDTATLLILPFEDLGPAPDSTFFSEGLADDLISALASADLDRLRVIGRVSARRLSSSMAVHGRPPREVHLDYVLRGSVRREGARIRVVASLGRLEDGSTVWARAYDREAGRELDVQTEVAARVADALSLHLHGVVPSDPAPDSREVRDSYLVGRHLLRQTDPAAQSRSIALFQRAATADPRFVPAIAYLAEAHLWFGNRDSARRAAERALALDSTRAHAHYVLGQLALIERRDLEAAEHESRRALELAPGLPEYHVALAYVLSIQGRHEPALAEMRIADELDPVAAHVSSDAGLIYYWARRYADAVRTCRRTLELGPAAATALSAYDCIMAAETQRGRERAAGEAAAAWIREAGVDPRDVGWSEDVPAAERMRSFRRWRLERVREAREAGAPVSFQLACLYADLGSPEQALRELEAASRERSLIFPSITVEPRLDVLRHDPRFTALVRRGHPGA